MKDRFKKIVKGFFGWFTSFFGGTFAEFGRSVKNIGQSPLPCSISLAIMLSRLAAMAMFVFSFVVFVLDNGYMEQIRVIGGGLVQWSQAFTFGTLSYYFGGFALPAWTIVLGLSFFAIHIVFIIKEPGIKRILMIILMLIVLAGLVLYLLFIGGALGDLVAPVVSFESLMENIQSQGLQGFAIPIYLGALVITLFAASVMAVKSTLRTQMKQWLSSVISVYLGLPLLLWFTQNLLALAAMIVFLLLFGGILYLLFSLLVSKLGDSGGKESGEPGKGSADETSGGSNKKAAMPGVSGPGQGPGSAQDPAQSPGQGPGYGSGQGPGQSPGYGSGQGPGHGPGPGSGPDSAQGQGSGQRVVEVDAGARLWKIKSATGDYVQSVSGSGATGEVCTAAEFDKGKVIIKQGGGEVSQIPWKPKK